ncbi:hypothetical protein GCM10010182_80800 [Actinomadura cremea]|nr:hypothetical protein GCM10010182_80800 [Actinomadura cremea]
MRVELTTAVLETDAHAEEILRLLHHFKQGRHEWSVNPLLTDTIESFIERNVPKLAPRYLALMDKAAEQYAYTPPGDAAAVRVSPEDVEDHVEDLGRSAVVMVENDATDGGFIKAVALVLKDAALLEALDREWLVIDHGGGCGDTIRRAKDKHGRFRRLTRVAVLLDSDRVTPDDPPQQEPAIGDLRARGIKVHVLRLRESENYIPDKCLRKLPSQQTAPTTANALAQLSKTQRGHYDMKKGFQKGKVSMPQRPLFGGLSPQLVRDLTGGFGPKTINCLVDHAHLLSEEDFRSDVGETVPDELRDLLAMLREIL